MLKSTCACVPRDQRNCPYSLVSSQYHPAKIALRPFGWIFSPKRYGSTEFCCSRISRAAKHSGLARNCGQRQSNRCASPQSSVEGLYSPCAVLMYMPTPAKMTNAAAAMRRANAEAAPRCCHAKSVSSRHAGSASVNSRPPKHPPPHHIEFFAINARCPAIHAAANQKSGSRHSRPKSQPQAKSVTNRCGLYTNTPRDGLTRWPRSAVQTFAAAPSCCGR